MLGSDVPPSDPSPHVEAFPGCRILSTRVAHFTPVEREVFTQTCPSPKVLTALVGRECSFQGRRAEKIFLGGAQSVAE